jgi:hypothetical protein
MQEDGLSLANGVLKYSWAELVFGWMAFGGRLLINLARVRNGLLALGLLCCLPMASRGTVAPQDPKELAAQRADTVWLALVDSGQYAESWKQAGAAIQAAVTQDKWVETIQRVRDQMGKMVTRRLKSASYATTLPGAPDGQYEVIIFETSFEHKQLGYETVVTSREKDGVWRVAGYYIK